MDKVKYLKLIVYANNGKIEESRHGKLTEYVFRVEFNKYSYESLKQLVNNLKDLDYIMEVKLTVREWEDTT